MIPRLTPARSPLNESNPSGDEGVTGAATGSFSLALYIQHREYNAAIGAALLYLSLLFLRPAMETILNGAR